MGSDKHLWNYTVFGREVNLASRLESLSGSGRIIISDATYHQLLRSGPALAGAHARRLDDLGFADDAALAAAIRSGTFDRELTGVGRALAAAARDQLLVANPDYLATDAG